MAHKDFSTLTSRVLEQTKARVIQGNTHFKGKLLSIFETATEAIRKGKAAKPTEFGKMVKIQEAENQKIQAGPGIRMGLGRSEQNEGCELK